MRTWLKILIYISIAFVLYYLYRQNMLIMPAVFSVKALLFSVLLLFIGFIFDALTWQVVLRTSRKKILISDALISYGLFVFTKYLPGKLWVIIGKAGYIAERYALSSSHVTALSFLHQIVVLITGSIVGGLCLLVLFPSYITFSAFLGLIAISLIFTMRANKAVNYLLGQINKLLKKNIDSISITPNQIFVSLCFSVTTWLFWGFGFYFFAQAISEVSVNVFIMGFFPVATVLGVVAILFPGGIGIREGVLALLLGRSLASTALISSISVFSRIWFLGGEAFIFILSLLLLAFRRFNKT